MHLLAPALAPSMDARIATAPGRAANVAELAGGTLYANVAATGKRHAITSAGNPRNPQMTPDGRVIFDTDTGTKHSAIPTTGIFPLLPEKSMAFWGDSQTASNTGIYPARVAAVTGIPAYNGGIAGQGSSDIAVRQGGLVPLVTVTGGSIPASGSVAVTVAPDQGWRVNGSGTFSFGGTLAGVPGLLAHDLVTGAWTFTRNTSGNVTAVPAGTPYLVTVGATHENKIQVIMAGRNNVSAPNSLEWTRRDIKSMTDFIKPYVRRYLVLSVLNGKSEGRNSAAWQSITAHNKWLSDTYGPLYYDLRRDFIDQPLSRAGITPTPADTTAMANDAPPPSIMADELHPTDAGYTVIGDLVAEQLTAKGWTL